MDEINRRFKEDKPALAYYNWQDCVLVNRIFDTTHLMEFLLERASVTGLAADRSGGSVAAFTHLYLPSMHRLGYVAPIRVKNPKSIALVVLSWTQHRVSMTQWWYWTIKAYIPLLFVPF